MAAIAQGGAARTPHNIRRAVIAAWRASTLRFLGGLAGGPAQLRLFEALGGMLDEVVESPASFPGATSCHRMRGYPMVALLGLVAANALIVPASLLPIRQGLGFYTTPFAPISFDGVCPLLSLLGMAATAMGEVVVIYVLGTLLARALASTRLAARLLDDGEAIKVV